jgi:transposase
MSAPRAAGRLDSRSLLELAELVRLQAARIEEQQDVIAGLQTELANERVSKAELERQLEDLRRQLYGKTSEKLDPQKGKLALEAIQEDAALAEAKQPERPPPGSEEKDPARRRQGGGRRPIPEELEVVRIVLDVPESKKICPQTGVRLVVIREEISRKLEWVPGKYICKEYVRPIYGHPAKSLAPVIADLPQQVLPGSDVESGFLAHLIVSKYLDHLPWHRQEQIAARAGLAIERRKMGRWSAEVAALLEPMYRRLGVMILESGYWMVDETFVDVLDPDRPGEARTAWLWSYLSMQAQAVIFDFNPSRSQDSPAKFFPAGAKGVLQSDGYAVYPALIEERPGIVQANCWSHARRYFVKASEGGGQTVLDILADIQKLFQIERDAQVRRLSGVQREQLRRERGVEIILDRLHKQMLQAQTQALPQSRIGKAVDYALTRWTQLSLYAQPGYGQVEISTNLIENNIRPIALGRRNWLFIGHPNAGKKSAIFYSLFATCRLCGVCPEKYLHWLLPKLAAATNQTVAGLLPHHYAAELKAPPGKAEPDG